MTDAMSLRKEINASLEGDARVSVNDLVIKACVHTIQGLPEVQLVVHRQRHQDA